MLLVRTKESQKRIHDMANEMLFEVKLQAIREELELTQAQLAKAMEITQPSVVAIEYYAVNGVFGSLKTGNNPEIG